MTDWADGIEARNYGIKSEIDASMFSELMRSIIPLAMIAGALLFYSWVRSEIVNLGYENQNLFAREESLLRAQKRLVLEEETLCDPERIDLIARNELGMTSLRPNQFLPKQDAERNLSNTIAMAESEAGGLKIASTALAPIPAN
jgi:cell division protein FtsL